MLHPNRMSTSEPTSSPGDDEAYEGLWKLVEGSGPKGDAPVVKGGTSRATRPDVIPCMPAPTVLPFMRSPGDAPDGSTSRAVATLAKADMTTENVSHQEEVHVLSSSIGAFSREARSASSRPYATICSWLELKPLFS